VKNNVTNFMYGPLRALSPWSNGWMDVWMYWNMQVMSMKRMF